MTPLDAVAAAIRERLLAGRPAPLPGLGTLVRQHVASRIQERADGTRMLMPPGETIGLASEGAAEHESLGLAFGRFRGLEGAQAVRAYGDAMDQIEARLSATGEVRLPGVGLLRRTSGGIILGVEADLLAAVNRTYEGLAPVGAAPVPAAVVAPPMPPPTSLEEDAADAPAPSAAPSPTRAPEVEVTVVGSSQDDAFGVPIHSAAEADDVEAGSPLRDLSSVLPETPTDLGPQSETPAEGITSPQSDSVTVDSDSSAVPVESPAPDDPGDAVRQSDAEVEETPLPDWAEEPTPEEPSSDESLQPDADDAPTSAAFVDEHTLDADLDELAVPFGAGAVLSDLLPPTARPDEPQTEWSPPETEPLPDIATPSETEPALAFADVEPDAEIEDVPYEIVEPDPSPMIEPVIERVGPSADLDALLAEPGAETAFPADPRPTDPFADLDLGEAPAAAALVETVPEEAVPVAKPTSRFPWWLLILAVLLALALLAAWLWPRFATRTADAAPQTEQTLPGPTRIEPARAESDDAAPAQTEVSTLDTQAPTGDADVVAPAEAAPPVARTPTRSTPTASGGGVTRDDDPLPARPGLGQAPSAGYAISPPRVVGLTGDDVRALSGRDPVDPSADAWTMVVLSTTSRDDANALSARYRSAGYRTGVVGSTNGDRSIHRVAVGQFSDRTQAQRLSDRLPPQAPADSWPLDLRTL